MDVISVSDLRDDTEAVLRRVEAGETLIVQRDGQAVAQIGPLQDQRPTWISAERFFAEILR
jgi:antitoxin (DNA-binding transcriptional repressor) of toxin-antitoxin stability system